MKQIVQILRPHLMSGLLSIYDEAMEICTRNNEEDLTLLTFQELLSQVPKWSQVLVDQEAQNIVRESDCDYIEDLLTATFVCHTKILTSVRVAHDNRKRQINLKIPSVERFIHHTYIEIAREFWKHPYLVKKDDVSKLQYQKNLRDVEGIITACIENTVRKLLPVKNILKEYLADDEDDEDDEDASNTSSNSSSQAGGGTTSSNVKESASPKAPKNEESSTTLKNRPGDDKKEATSTDEEKDKAAGGKREVASADVTTTTAESAKKAEKTNAKSPSDYEELNRILKVEKEVADRAQIKEVSIDTDKKIAIATTGASGAPGTSGGGGATPAESATKSSNSSSSNSSSSNSSSITDLLGSSSKPASTGITDLLGSSSKPASTGITDLLGSSSKPASTGITDLLGSSSKTDSTNSATVLGGGGGGLTDLLGSGGSSGSKSTASASSEIALDSLGEIEQVNVDFGMSGASSAPRASAAPSTNVKRDVLTEFDRIANSTSDKNAGGSTPTNANSTTDSKPASSYSFF